MSDYSSTESEPEQYPMVTPHSPSSPQEPQVTKLEKPKRKYVRKPKIEIKAEPEPIVANHSETIVKPKRVMSEAQLKALSDAREKRKLARANVPELTIEQPVVKIKRSKSKTTGERGIKEVHHHHYAEKPAVVSQTPIQPKVEKKPREKKNVLKPMTVTKKSNVINFV